MSKSKNGSGGGCSFAQRGALSASWMVSVFGSISLILSVEAQVESTTATVGRKSDGQIITPVNQVITPAGIQVDLPDLRPQALALRPDGKILVTSGKTSELLVIAPHTNKILQRVPLPPEPANQTPSGPVTPHILQPDKSGQLSFTGLIFSPDGTRIYLANVDGSIKVFATEKDGRVTALKSLRLPPANAPARQAEIPAGLCTSRDGKRLYVALNLSNRLGELDAETGEVLRLWDVGVAPFDVVIAGKKAYVSNWGGRRPGEGDLTGPAGRGTKVRVDPVRHIANEGSVSIIDLEDNARARTAKLELLVGLHASALALSPNGRYVVVANAASDTLSVIDSKNDKIVETIWTRQNPSDLFGAIPNALAFNASGNKLFVCNGTQNAVGVINFSPGKSKLQGLVPVGWFPGAIVHDAKRKALYVANIKGLSPGEARTNQSAKFNSHQYHGTLSFVPEPTRRQLEAWTKQVLANMRYPLLAQASLRPRKDQPARPVPQRVGEPSVFKHVVYIIKENRTYDQVFGDMREGNGDPSLCIFGERFTPNQHKIAREFVLLDNTYCSGAISSDGHQWATTAIVTDYLERSFAGFPRSYPDGMEDSDVDALAYSPAGFIWDNALAHGKTVRDYGEFAITRKSWKDKTRKGTPAFRDHYQEFLKGTDAIHLYSEPAVESLRPHLNTNTVGWDMAVPDVFRAAQFIKELRQNEMSNTFPNLVIICLPNDHTSGTAAGSPTPAAQVADNDLAFGQIVEAISRSRFWPETCILAIEDDPQDGWDHVSGYRTTAYVVSPYTKRGQVVSTQYNQTSVLRTIELILGLPPMNQMDATATPMFDCFIEKPDLTPYATVKNNIALDEMNPEPKKIADPLLRKYAYASARLPLHAPDKCSEDLLNRILWHAMKGSAAPYPAWAVRKVDDDD
jgi:YVTN family beta-propeller protein